MSAPAWTRGEWSVPHFARDNVNCDCGYVLGGDYMGAIATVHFSGQYHDREDDNPPLDEAKANARLIAAAPDLYAALEAMIPLAAAHLRGLGPEDPAVGALADARAVMAKARGEQP